MSNRTNYQRTYYRDRVAQRQAATEYRLATAHPLTAARKSRHLSMKGLAEAMGLASSSWRQVWAWEHGRNVPSPLYAEKLAQTLGFTSGDEVRALCEAWQREQKEEGASDR